MTETRIAFPNKRPEPRDHDLPNRKHSLEHQTTVFTIFLYLFICIVLLIVHYAAPSIESDDSGAAMTEGVDNAASSSASPYNPKN